MTQTTQNDVAMKAGVSQKTVSRVLNNEPTVTEETILKVQSAIDELNYVPNESARRLSSGRTKTIGVTVGWPIHMTYISKLIEAAYSESHRNGYRLSIFSINDYDANQIVETYRGKHFDGLILDTPSSMDENLLAGLRTEQVPYVMINPNSKMRKIDASIVEDNDEEGSRLITQYLISLGHQKIGYVAYSPQILSQKNRLIGYKKALSQAGILYRDAWVVSDPGGKDILTIGFELGNQLIEKYPELTAILAGNDDIALGICRAAWQKGMKLPDDLSVGGYNDHFYAAMYTPPLTTLHQPIDEEVQAAMQLLLQRINDPTCKPVHRIFSDNLIIRESCKPPRQQV